MTAWTPFTPAWSPFLGAVGLSGTLDQDAHDLQSLYQPFYDKADTWNSYKVNEIRDALNLDDAGVKSLLTYLAAAFFQSDNPNTSPTQNPGASDYLESARQFLTANAVDNHALLDCLKDLSHADLYLPWDKVKWAWIDQYGQHFTENDWTSVKIAADIYHSLDQGKGSNPEKALFYNQPWKGNITLYNLTTQKFRTTDVPWSAVPFGNICTWSIIPFSAIPWDAMYLNFAGILTSIFENPDGTHAKTSADLVRNIRLSSPCDAGKKHVFDNGGECVSDGTAPANNSGPNTMPCGPGQCRLGGNECMSYEDLTLRCKTFEGKDFDPATCSCVAHVDQGRKQKDGIASCASKGHGFDPVKATCIPCSGGTVVDPLHGTCGCPSGTEWDMQQNHCVTIPSSSPPPEKTCADLGLLQSDRPGDCISEADCVKQGMVNDHGQCKAKSAPPPTTCADKGLLDGPRGCISEKDCIKQGWAADHGQCKEKSQSHQNTCVDKGLLNGPQGCISDADCKKLGMNVLGNSCLPKKGDDTHTTKDEKAPAESSSVWPWLLGAGVLGAAGYGIYTMQKRKPNPSRKRRQ